MAKNPAGISKKERPAMARFLHRELPPETARVISHFPSREELSGLSAAKRQKGALWLAKRYHIPTLAAVEQARGTMRNNIAWSTAGKSYWELDGAGRKKVDASIARRLRKALLKKAARLLGFRTYVGMGPAKENLVRKKAAEKSQNTKLMRLAQRIWPRKPCNTLREYEIDMLNHLIMEPVRIKGLNMLSVELGFNAPFKKLRPTEQNIVLRENARRAWEGFLIKKAGEMFKGRPMRGLNEEQITDIWRTLSKMGRLGRARKAEGK